MSNRSISHIEIPAQKRPEMAKFYEQIFGWKIEHMDAKGMPYSIWQSGNVRGGFPEIGVEAKAGKIVLYLDSDDIEADLELINTHGGKTLKGKTEIPGIGWYAEFADPSGNHMALHMRMKR